MDCLLFAPISNFPSKDCSLYIKGELNPKQGITSSIKLLSDVISRFTECSLSFDSLYVSRSMEIIATEMFKCVNNINPKS